MSEHTQGPWRVTETMSDEFPYSVGTEAWCVAEVELIPLRPAEAKANAHLIAAAPELLSAAKAILNNWDYGSLARAVRSLADVVKQIEEGEK